MVKPEKLYPNWVFNKYDDPFEYSSAIFYEHRYHTYADNIDQADHPDWMKGWEERAITNPPSVLFHEMEVTIGGKKYLKSVIQVLVEQYVLATARRDGFNPNAKIEDVEVFQHNDKFTFLRLKGKAKLSDPSYPYRYSWFLIDKD